jgi:hypothetical protein
MQFKHPEILWALLLLAIPIIVHLFQLRKFQKTPFTNVKFLKEISIQTRKSSQLKRWLTLLTRCLALAALIIAFAQPYFANFTVDDTSQETVLYLDNSFSMQAKGNRGVLLDRAIQDIIATIPENEEITLFTNNHTFKKQKISAFRNQLLRLNYSSKQLTVQEAFLAAKNNFAETTSKKNIVLISDFQQHTNSIMIADSTTNVSFVSLQPITGNNISLDSVFIDKTDGLNWELTVSASAQQTTNTPISISLLNNNQLVAKTAISFSNNTNETASFTIPAQQEFIGKLEITDDVLQYDNTLFFTINKPEKIKVLSINKEDGSFLKKLYQEDEFEYTEFTHNQIDYNKLPNQNLIILNGLVNIPNALATVLQNFTNNGGSVVVVPSLNSNIDSYNALFNSLQLPRFNSKIEAVKNISTIVFDHPLYNGVFDKRVTNFQYPTVKTYYNITQSNTNAALKFDNNHPFLYEKNKVIIITAPLSEENSNFIKSPLIVPTFYNIATNSLALPKLFYLIGNKNTISLKQSLNKDDILHLKSDDYEFIPLQQSNATVVTLTTEESPDKAAIYQVKNNNTTLKNIAYNYNRKESNLQYLDIEGLAGKNVYKSVPEIFSDLKKQQHINELWKWFVIFALVFLAIEILILKYFK